MLLLVHHQPLATLTAYKAWLSMFGEKYVHEKIGNLQPNEVMRYKARAEDRMQSKGGCNLQC